MIDYRVYLVTDDPSVYKRDFVQVVEEAVRGGVTVVQYRDTESSDRQLYCRAKALKEMLKSYNIPLVINNNVGLALALNADAIHIGQSDLPIKEVREIVGDKMEIGLSLTCESDIRDDELKYADVLGIGPVFDATKTKRDAAPEMGLSGLSRMCELTKGFRNVAIGGINLKNGADVIKAGAEGLAIVSAFSRYELPCEAAKEFRKMFE